MDGPRLKFIFGSIRTNIHNAIVMGEIGGKGGEQGRTVRISQDNISFFKMGIPRNKRVWIE